MNCPNCKAEFTKERGGKSLCPKCGWLEKIDDLWSPCDPPTEPETKSALPDEGDPPAGGKSHPQDEAENEDAEDAETDGGVDRSEPGQEAGDAEPKPKPKAKSYLGGRVTVTEVDDESGN